MAHHKPLEPKLFGRLVEKMSMAIIDASEPNECACIDTDIVLEALGCIISSRLHLEHPDKTTKREAEKTSYDLIAAKAMVNKIKAVNAERERIIKGN